MRNILIVSTKHEIQDEIIKMIDNNDIPSDNYSFFIEMFDRSLEKLGVKFQNIYTIDDLRNTLAIEKGIEKCREWGPFDCVISANEYTVLLAAHIREKLNVNGPLLDDVLKFRDKVLMKQCLEGTNIRFPRLYEHSEVINGQSVFPIIVKPRTYAGSIGVKVVSSKQEYVELFDNNKTDYTRDFIAGMEFDRDDIEIEEYIDGTVFHIDGLIFEGEIIFCLSSLYIKPCINYVNYGPLVSQTISNPSKRAEWSDFAARVHEHMHIPDGAFHLEAFQAANGKVFLEVGIRPGGACVVPAIARAMGINLELAHIQCQLGIKPTIPRYQDKELGWAVFPKSPAGKGEQTVTAVRLPSFSGYVEPNWNFVPSIGSNSTTSFSSYRSNLGAFTFCSDDAVLLGATLHMLMSEYRVDVE